MRIEWEIKLDFKDVLLRPKRSTLKSRSEVSLERTFVFRHSKRTWTGVPIIAANMDTTGTFEMAEVLAQHKMMVALHKHYTVEDHIEWSAKHPSLLEFVAASSGTSNDDFAKISRVIDETGIGAICLDVANGYSEHFVNFVRRCRERFTDQIIFAGNVVTGEMVEELILSGADVVKVGIGPGSVCTTRKKAGVGYPQLSAVIECADAAHGLQGLIISDGGCVMPGDVVKSQAAGADFTMLGGMLAGHDESGGQLVVDGNGNKFKMFYGMSSSTAMQKYHGKVAEYRSSEGKTVKIPYRGPVKATVLDILGGLRSACTYVGASQLKELSKRTTFIRVTQQTNEVFATYNLAQSNASIYKIVGTADATPSDAGTTNASESKSDD